jgi:hypothetical protein
VAAAQRALALQDGPLDSDVKRNGVKQTGF